MPSDALALCRACGLCCDGTLFTRIPLAADEVVPATLVVTMGAGGGRYVPQRCAGLQGTTCACYGERPRVCRAFECTLLVAHREGEVGLPEAVALVTRARQLTGQAQQAFLDFNFGRRR